MKWRPWEPFQDKRSDCSATPWNWDGNGAGDTWKCMGVANSWETKAGILSGARFLATRSIFENPSKNCSGNWMDPFAGASGQLNAAVLKLNSQPKGRGCARITHCIA